MAISRYWRLVGLATMGNVALELSEARIYEGGVLADASATLTATIAPTSGAVADLRDGVATGVVSWPYASYSAASFALVWDFGAGLGVDMAQLSLGAGTVADNFVFDLTLQYSDDALTWVAFGSRSGVVWPGALSMTAAPQLGDPNFSNVKILMRAVGVDKGKVITDASNYNRIIGISGLPQLSSAQSAFGDVSILVNPNFNLDQNQYIYLASNISDFTFAGDFTIELKIFPTSFGATWGSFLLATINSSSTSGTGLSMIYGYAALANKISFDINGASCYSNAAPVLNEWSDIAITRISGVVRMFVRGFLQIATFTNHAAIGASTFLVGRAPNGAGTTGINGYVDELRITDGVGLYSNSYTPATTRFPTKLASPAVAAKHRFAGARDFQRMLPAIELPNPTAESYLRESTFFDAYSGPLVVPAGGVVTKTMTGNITGTVKNTPATPVSRRVLLMDQRSQLVVRETWSDPVTGAYAFNGLNTATEYAVISYDHTRTYRAVIADYITPDPLP